MVSDSRNTSACSGARRSVLILKSTGGSTDTCDNGGVEHEYAAEQTKKFALAGQKKDKSMRSQIEA